MDTWGIFYCQRDEQLFSQLIETLQQCIKSYDYTCNPPAVFAVPSNRVADWESALRKVLNPNVKMVLMILPGRKGKAELYAPMKRLLL